MRQEKSGNTKISGRWKTYAIDISLILALIIFGVIFSQSLDLDDTPSYSRISWLDIFLNNTVISLAAAALTKYAAYPIIIFNSIFLGLSIGLHAQIEGILITFQLLSLHGLLEIFGWVVCLELSRKFLQWYRNMLRIRRVQSPPKSLLVFLLFMVAVYLAAAILEEVAFVWAF